MKELELDDSAFFRVVLRDWKELKIAGAAQMDEEGAEEEDEEPSCDRDCDGSNALADDGRQLVHEDELELNEFSLSDE